MEYYQRKKGIDITIRFTSGWNLENMLIFAEGMMLRDYSFDEHKKSDEEKISDPWNVDFQANDRYRESLEMGLKRINSIVGGVHLAKRSG